MEGRAFKFAEWTRTLLDKVKLKILPKRFRSKKNEKENGSPYFINNRDGHHHSIEGSENGGDDETPSEDGVVKSDQTQPGHYGSAEPSNDYSNVRGVPPHRLSQSSSIHYLKHPGVMLTPAEASGDFHNLRIHSGEKSYRCGYCGEEFRKKAILKKHVRTHQGVVHNSFGQAGKKLPDVILHGRCAGMPIYVNRPISNKTFEQKSTLRQHGCVHIESRPYLCVECGKRFRQQSHLTQHLRIHSNEKPFKCTHCGRNFRQRTILNQHVRIHTGEKPYKCLQCGKNFRQRAILDQHTRTHQD